MALQDSAFEYLPQTNTVTKLKDENRICLEHIFLKQVTRKEEPQADLLRNNISNHYTILLKLQSLTTLTTTTEVNVQKLVNYKKLQNLMKNTDCSSITCCKDPELSIANFIKIIEDSIVLSPTAKKNNRKGKFVPEKKYPQLKQKYKQYAKRVKNI